MDSLLQGLNEGQQVAVKNVDGPCLVIAGAGSGKTRVLTYRIAYLLSLGVPAHNILALTFTNKAAAEMKDRIGKIVGEEVARNLNMGTFHSVFARILRRESEHIPGYDSNYSIIDTDDVKKLLGQVISSLNLDKDVYKATKVASLISKAKNDLITADMYEMSDMYKLDRMSGMPGMAAIYREYTSMCRKSNSMDFDDLLLMTNIMFRDCPTILEKYQKLFKYILVDEYQDTNSCQYFIIKKLAMPENNLCVVGDDAQSIYSFRGAKIENILGFSRDYPNYHLYKLEQNYRSTQTIVNAANSLIAKNSKQIPKTIFSESEQGDLIKLVESSTDAEEGIKIASMIADLAKSGEDYSDCAILYRTNSQSRILEEALNKKRIPCKIVKGTSFFQRKEVKDVLSYVRVVINPQDEIALERIVNYPARGIGDTTMAKIVGLSRAHSISVWSVMSQIERTGDMFPNATKTKIKNFVSLMQEFMNDKDESDAYSLMNRIVEKIDFKSSLIKEYTNEEAHERYDNIEELLNGAKEFVENEIDPDAIALHNYIEKIALMTDIDEDSVENPNKVLLMTVHAAKGLEFKHCFIVGMEEDVFPSSMSKETPSQVEEERRLFYVAITRAMKTATISYALARRRYGSLNVSNPSRFISEIASEYVDGKIPNRGGLSSSSSLFSHYSNNLKNSFSSFKKTQPSGGSFGGSHWNNANRATFEKKSSSNASRPTAFSNYQKPTSQPFAHFNEKPAQPNLVTPSNPMDIKDGQRVFHAKFGFGMVKERSGDDASASAIISFDNWGDKKLLLKFAKLQIVEN